MYKLRSPPPPTWLRQPYKVGHWGKKMMWQVRYLQRYRPSQSALQIFHRKKWERNSIIKFKPINFYCLRPMRGLHYKTCGNQNQISIEYGMQGLKKNARTDKDFGKSIYEVWLKSFINYTSILISFFSPIALNLHSALTIFNITTLTLWKVYKWLEVVLLQAIKIHIHIIFPIPSDETKLVISPNFKDQFCITMTLLGTNSPQSKTKWKYCLLASSHRISK